MSTENLRKEEFQKFCQAKKEIPLFLTFDWFSGVFKEENWQVAIAKNGNEISAVWPYVVSKNKGFKNILNQFLSPYGGVFYNYPEDQNPIKKKSFEEEATRELLSQLPKVHQININCDPCVSNWLPFYWNGFKQTTRYTYILEDIANSEMVFSSFKENIRREIRKAEKTLTIAQYSNYDKFYELKKTETKGYRIPKKRFMNVVNHVVNNNCGEVLAAIDKDENIHSILLYVWDHTSAYYLHGLTRKAFKNTGSMSLLLWEAIKRSKTNVKCFNFEGSMNPNIERYFRSFGGLQTPYFNLNQTNSKLLQFYQLVRG